MGIVVPAVLPSAKSDLDEKLELFGQLPGVTRVQIDVVDGRFAAPPSWPYVAPEEFKAMHARGEVLPHTDRIEYEIDLMCLDIDSAIDAWLPVGATRLTLHAESTLDLLRHLAALKERYGILVSFGLALSVASDLKLIEPCLPEVAYVQFMGIARIGRQGQPFDARAYEHIRLFHSRHPDIPIQIDGGVSLANAEKLITLGATDLIVGSGIVRAKDPKAALAALQKAANPYRV